MVREMSVGEGKTNVGDKGRNVTNQELSEEKFERVMLEKITFAK